SAGLPSNGPTYDLGTFLRFAIKCTDCLEFIHRNNVVHGEVRLSAFQWTGEDASRVKMWNFGSGTKSLETYLTSEGWRKTATNKDSMDMLQNLLVYMSPEQTGRTTYVPDHRSDIYSLGIVFFVLLTGRNPFDGGPLEILNGILSRKVPLIHEIQLEVPEVVARIVEKMTNKSPDDRYSSAYGIRADLKECLKRLKYASESCVESFPLAERDVASVFTLPKTIYGRQGIISEMTYIIQRVAGVYKSIRNRREKSYSTGSTMPTITSGGDFHASNASVSDGLSDRLSNNEGSALGGTVGAGPKSNASPSYCSGFDGSDISSGNGRPHSSKQGVEIVSIAGPGGVGKSTVFNAVQNVARQHGYVATSKFDSRHKVPYSCILKSLSQILQQILSESEEDIHVFYNHLKSHLGSQFCKIELLADLVPELKPLLDPVDSEDSEEPIDQIHLDNVETRIRFHNLFVEVFRALAQWRMVTLFLDDLHLADEPSLELIESMISSRLKILIFMAYRDQEATDTLDRLLTNDYATIHHLRIDALDFDSVADYISDALHRPLDLDRDSILPLADIVYKKTRGNAFYTSQLLATLEKKKLIFFNWEENEWDYNLADIQQAITTRDGADRDAELDISFLVNRLKELPLDGQRLLKWASFVGDTFSWNTVKYLMLHSDPESDTAGSSNSVASATAKDASRTLRSQHKPRDPINGLQAALQEGYIMPLESDEFKWSHDRYSQAAMELANPKSREKIHFKIAKYLLHESADSFLIADHLLKCLNLVCELDHKSCYRDILYEAGNKARASGAHKMAFSYYKAAIALLSDHAWEGDEYARTHYLYTNAVSLSWIVGEYDTTEAYLDAIFNHTSDPMDRVTAYRIQHKYFFSRQMHEEGAQALRNCLAELQLEDFNFLNTRQELHTVYTKVIGMIREIGVDEMCKMGPCDDPKLKAIMTIIEEMCTAAYWLGNQTEMFYLAAKLVYFSLTDGMTSTSGIALTFLGLCCVEYYQDFSFGEEIGAAGCVLAEKYGSNNEKGRAICLYSIFLNMWKHHHREAIPWFNQSLRYSMAAGDRIYASFSHLHVADTMFYTGSCLSDTLVEAESCYDDIHAWSSSADTNILIMAIIRVIKALQGHTFNSSAEEIFDGDDGFNDKHFIAESCKQSANINVPLNWYDSFRMLPLVLYGHYDHAIAVGYMCHRGAHNHPCHRHTRMFVYLQSLAILEKIRTERDVMTQEEIDVYFGQVETNQAMLKPWTEHSRINYLMWYTLVEAEIAATMTSDVGKAIQLYENAIDQSREGGWYLELCICHEYAGGFYYRTGLKNAAYGMLKKSVNLYLNHGSYGKAQHLNAKYSSLLAEYEDDRVESHETGVQTDPFPFLGPQGTWSTSSMGPINSLNEPFVAETIPPVTTEQTLLTLDILDMASILKSSQVISSEVKFDSLLKSMMSIILENSGADCGAIIVKEEKYGMCAYGSQQDGSMTFDPPRPLAEDDELVSSRIIHHTINTSESIFIHNVEQDSRFAVGPWYERVGGKSVICMPIIHKTALAGCVFLEGSSGIFTQRHITVLSLLCQQMGISITNAFLFKSVQRVTMANMRMIEMQKKALEDARKSKEAAVRATRLREIFLANMSHEIRTPFSGFYGMISLLAETELDPEQRDLVKTAKESCEILLQIIDDLLNFSKLQAGKVTLDLAPIVVEDLIADVVEMLIAMAIQKSINIAYMVADNVPPVVMADGNRLRQVLINLLGNAIKFTHEGEIRIQCSLDTTHPPSGDQVALLFEVIDTGIGISDEQRKVLFEPFSQVDGSTTRKYGGTGLGLSICLQLVELMSGSINVSSVPGKGSDFYFSVRVSKLRTQPTKSIQQDGYYDERTTLARCKPPSRSTLISRLFITIMSFIDNPVAQKLLLKQLTRLGFQVECANNGLEAVNSWNNQPDGYFVMAFFDHHMPKCDGVAATKRIREIEKEEERTSKLPIVALTADVQESAKQICMNAGMDGYLTKPLNQKVLAEALRKYCHHPHTTASPTPPPPSSPPSPPPPSPPNPPPQINIVTEALAITET
ncbi:Serine/threonine kinase hybrid, partial [Mucor lusitanicus CBS 277.49]